MKWEMSLTLIFICLIATPIFWGVYWLLRKEIFRYTHYPMRFNRKTRKVHVFRLDGTIMTEDWDKLYFTLGEGQPRTYEVRGHRLAEDGITVLETFALAFHSTLYSPMLCSQWEFIRRYMEDGPEKLVGQVEHVMDIADKRETFWNGFHRHMAEYASIPPLAWLLSPLLFLGSITRWVAMQTSKIPVWPAEIEAESQIEPGDPYIRDAQHLAKKPQEPSLTAP
jgi:hypothetical protein